MSSHFKWAAAAAMLAVLAGCQNTKTMEKDIADLKEQVSKLQTEQQQSRSTIASADGAARSAAQTAGAAQSSADQALAAAQSGQTCCRDATEKMNRMFQKSISK